MDAVFRPVLTRSTSCQHEWTATRGGGRRRDDVAVRDAHAQEIQPEYMIRTTASPLSVTRWACTHLGRTAG
jgi:hypothetical protein